MAGKTIYSKEENLQPPPGHQVVARGEFVSPAMKANFITIEPVVKPEVKKIAPKRKAERPSLRFNFLDRIKL